MHSKLKIWFSGVFATGAIVHALRLIFHLPVTIGNFNIPMNLSLWVAIIAGVISLLLLGICPCNCAKKCSR